MSVLIRQYVFVLVFTCIFHALRRRTVGAARPSGYRPAPPPAAPRPAVPWPRDGVEPSPDVPGLSGLIRG